MEQIFLLLGCNQGNCLETLRIARDEIEIRCGCIVKVSDVYKTAAWGEPNQPDFLNQAVELHSNLLPEELLKILLLVEERLGRVRKQKWAERTLDIDIIFYGKHVVATNNLTVPHPALAQRRFVLEPLNELASNFIHPILQKTVQQLLIQCVDNLKVDRIR